MVTTDQAITENPSETVQQEQTPAEATSERPPEDIDWKSKYEADISARDEQISKLESDSKANANRLRRVREENAEVSELKTRLDDLTVEMSSLPDVLSAVVEHGNDSEGLRARVSEVQQEARGKRDEQLFNTRHDQAVKRTEDVLQDIDEESAQDIRRRWRIAVDQQLKLPASDRNPGVFDELYVEAKEFTFNKMIEDRDAQLAAKDKEIEAAKSNFEEEYDVHNVDTGRSSGRSGNSSFDSLRQSDKRKMGLDELQEHKQKVLDAMAREAPA